MTLSKEEKKGDRPEGFLCTCTFESRTAAGGDTGCEGELVRQEEPVSRQPSRLTPSVQRKPKAGSEVKVRGVIWVSASRENLQSTGFGLIFSLCIYMCVI